mmetsp:Transcript_425/g.1446  ORF Transcript_425/g.1446 Transcript_425/m.1446 type:complete len:618 (+) Transcript_425:80-1933(+)
MTRLAEVAFVVLVVIPIAAKQAKDSCAGQQGASLLQVNAQRAEPLLSAMLLAPAVDNSEAPRVIFAEPRYQVLADTSVDEDFRIIPRPVEVRSLHAGPWLSSSLFIEDDGVVSAMFRKSVQHVFEQLKTIPVHLEAAEEQFEGTVVRLRLTALPAQVTSTTREQYTLVSSSDGVAIEAHEERGLFNGIMTLLQLLTQDGEEPHWRRPAVRVHDAPAMEWRGLMLDVSRHFFKVEEVKQVLTVMALFKFNRFHWHLTDDQGWRFPVATWPNLTRTGAWRSATPRNQADNFQRKLDGKSHGGAYTKREIEEVVRHATSLFIDIVPEVDMPGHTQAAVATYYDLGNTDLWGQAILPPYVANRFGPQERNLAPKNISFQFVRDVIDEEAKYFSSEYLHIGGDEVRTKEWYKSPSARRFVESHGFDPETQSSFVQAYFQMLAAEQVMKHGKRPVVWEEAAAEGKNLSTEAVVMLWLVNHNTTEQEYQERVQNLSRRGYDIVLTPERYTYLDFVDGDGGRYENPMEVGTTPITDVYAMAFPRSVEGGGRVLGAQAELWTEYIRNKAQLDYMAWPRGIALAERFWMGGTPLTFADFRQRLQSRLPDLDRLGVQYRPLDEKNMTR